VEAPVKHCPPVAIEPDLAFIRALNERGGDSLKKCFQCGTCSATCALAPDDEPFPRKEMAWAVWGMKERLLRDPDVWLCHQCNDCSKRCPRGARPGDVLAAIRQESVRQYSFPRFFGRWLVEPHSIPLLLGIPIALLALALYFRDGIAEALGLVPEAGERIVFAYSSFFPHWLINSFFGFFTLLVVIVAVAGVLRFWRALKRGLPGGRIEQPAKGLVASILATLKNILAHSKFAECTSARHRYLSHFCVLFGFLALTAVTLWVITAKYNPLIQGEFIYPFGFWNPWKMLANAGGAALVIGCLLMILERIRENGNIGAGSYSDWALLAMLLLAAGSGFFTEALHYLRLEPHRHIAYFAHLVFVFALLMYLPYSKLAHLLYRTTAMVFAEHTGRDIGGS
jgi:quinone-modifying oxidoreductase subunit QmoC